MSTTSDLNLHNVLCLACSSSIPSRNQAVHITNCCNQVICSNCIQANPRLTTYDPCLVCMDGIGASQSKLKTQNTPTRIINNSKSLLHPTTINDDSETMFVLGDDSDEDGEEQETSNPLQSPLPKPPAYQEAVNSSIMDNPQPSTSLPSHPDTFSPASDPSAISVSATPKYYINPHDTVHGIALHFGVDVGFLLRVHCSNNITHVPSKRHENFADETICLSVR